MRLDRIPWSCALGLFGVACISVPSYPEPAEHARLQPGFTPTKDQRGRWLCDDFDFVRVAAAQGDVLVELNNDIVVDPGKKIAGGGTEYSFVSSNTMFLGGDGTKVTFRLLVPDDAQQPLAMLILAASKSTGATVITYETHESKEQCVPVPPVEVIR